MFNCEALEKYTVLSSTTLPPIWYDTLVNCNTVLNTGKKQSCVQKTALLVKNTSIKTLLLMHFVIYNHTNKAPAKCCQHHKISGASRKTPNTIELAFHCILQTVNFAGVFANGDRNPSVMSHWYYSKITLNIKGMAFLKWFTFFIHKYRHKCIQHYWQTRFFG